MRILMLCDWLPPDFGAVGQYELLFARDHADAGHQVTLVGLSSTRASEVTERRGAGLLTVRRVARPHYDKQSLIKRARWTLMTNLILLWRSRRELRQTDEVRFTGSPPYMIHFVVPLAKMLGLRARYRITDFHPECLMAEYTEVPAWLSVLHRLTRYWRRRVDIIEVLGEDQRRICLAGGIASERLELIRYPSPVRFTGQENPGKPPAAIAGRRIALYSGNWGVAHDYATFTAAMARIEARQPGKMGVWLNATGSRAQQVYAILQSAGNAVALTAPVPLYELAGVLLAADVHIICLRDPFVGFVLPCKVYACIESGRPILFIGSDRSDIHSLCDEAASVSKVVYRRADVGDIEGVVQHLEDLMMVSTRRDDSVRGAREARSLRAQCRGRAGDHGPSGHVMGDGRARPNNGSLPDAHARSDEHAGCDPRLRLDNDGRADQW